MGLIEFFTIIYVIWNVIVFFIYGLDKKKAKENAERISEKTLLACALMMGGLGAILAMQMFRHKSKHLKFKIGVPLAFIINFLIIFYCTYSFLANQ